MDYLVIVEVEVPAHISILESMSGLSLMNKLARSGDVWCNHVLNSIVARGVLTKGRSTLSLPSRILAKAASVQLAGGLYEAFHFGPTRLNVSDAPTRDKALPPTARCSLLDFLLVRA